MGNSTDSDGDVVDNLGGLAVQNLLLAVNKMNVTVVFRRPSAKFSLEEGEYVAGSLVDRRSDIAIGILPLLTSISNISVSTNNSI
jgi:hypothetical protein